MPTRVKGVVQSLHFQFLTYVLNLFFQHNYAIAKICSYLAYMDAFVLAIIAINLEKSKTSG